MSKSTPKRLKRPSDPMQLAKLIGDIATGQHDRDEGERSLDNRIPPTTDEIKRVMSALGKLGGPKGGMARAAKLSKKRRIQIAKEAALARWGKK